MKTLLGIALAVFIVCLALSSCAYAGGWRYFHDHVRPTGRCGFGREVGASFYNSGYRTASGELFNVNALTAASRPGGFAMGSSVHVSNPMTGRSVTVRINDAGPWGEAWAYGVRLDLSPAAFRALGMTQSGWVCAQ